MVIVYRSSMFAWQSISVDTWRDISLKLSRGQAVAIRNAYMLRFHSLEVQLSRWSRGLHTSLHGYILILASVLSSNHKHHHQSRHSSVTRIPSQKIYNQTLYIRCNTMTEFNCTSETPIIMWQFVFAHMKKTTRILSFLCYIHEKQ
jgi:hypothetical protein